MTNNFNLVAPLYDRLADLVYGGELQAAQEAFLTELPDIGKVLFIGGGSGQTLRKLIRLKPQLEIYYLEASTRMMEISKRVISHEDQKRIEFKVGTENEIPPHYKFEGVITFFFLDLFREDRKERIFNKLNNHLKEKAIWLQADFLPARGFVASVRERLMFLFFKIFSHIEANRIHEDQKLFRATGFQVIQRMYFFKKQIYSAVYQKESMD